MNRMRIARIAGCFLLTFLLGGVAGWLARPTPAPLPSQMQPSAQRLLDNLDAQLHLSAPQRAELWPLLQEWERVAGAVPRRSPRRQQLFEEYSARIRARLTPEQWERYDRIAAEARAQWARRLRR